jgi:ketosteroid isomerase-like protein
MGDTAGVLQTERDFFTALTEGNFAALEQILAEDLTMVALNGSVLDRAALTGAIASGYLKFHEIRCVESVVRFHPPLSLVVGRTEMSGCVGGSPFTASSRYTHVYCEENGRYRLTAAQGTQIVGDSE